MNAKAIVVSVGTELTGGLVTDTNSAYLARRLAEAGIITLSHVTVDDHVDRIASAVAAAAQQAEVVVVTGGLGPTADDVTRRALAQAMGAELVLDRACLDEIRRFFRRRGRSMNRINRVQAMRPVGAESLHNPVGTAPGIVACLGASTVFVLPGVPAEMREMTELHVLPRLGSAGGQGCVVFRTVRAFGAGESDVGARLDDLMDRHANPLVGTTVASGLLSVRITARGQGRDETGRLADDSVQEVRRRLGTLAFGIDDDTLAGVVGGMLCRRNATLSVAESCTGGLLGKLLTDAGGASEYFLGGAICYADRIKLGVLGVPGEMLRTRGAVSEATAEAMARGARKTFDATYALAVTGVAGPTGGTETKPVGLVYTAVATPDRTQVQRNVFPGDRQIVRMRSSLTALNMLRLELLGGA